CYPCIVVHWYDQVGNEPVNDTRVWFFNLQCQHRISISMIHINTIYCATHLISVYGKHFIPPLLHPMHFYDSF
ncbi:hypothetical protein L210DRAFT_803830, partial [Boletus edulis BED1]